MLKTQQSSVANKLKKKLYENEIHQDNKLVYQVLEHTGQELWRLEYQIDLCPINDLPKSTLHLLNSFSAIKFVRPASRVKWGVYPKYVDDTF